jgi:hypothetical protein
MGGGALVLVWGRIYADSRCGCTRWLCHSLPSWPARRRQRPWPPWSSSSQRFATCSLHAAHVIGCLASALTVWWLCRFGGDGAKLTCGVRLHMPVMCTRTYIAPRAHAVAAEFKPPSLVYLTTSARPPPAGLMRDTCHTFPPWHGRCLPAPAPRARRTPMPNAWTAPPAPTTCCQARVMV